MLEAGLGFAVDLKKPGGFVGRDAVLAKKAEGPLTRRIVQVLVKDPEPMMFHAEVVRRSGKAVGYGSPLFSNSGCFTEAPPSSTGTTGFLPGSATGCTGDTRNVIEGTIGFWYRFYKGPKGTLQQGMQLSYEERATWQGIGGSPKATDAMWWTSLRYYLP